MFKPNWCIYKIIIVATYIVAWLTKDKQLSGAELQVPPGRRRRHRYAYYPQANYPVALPKGLTDPQTN